MIGSGGYGIRTIMKSKLFWITGLAGSGKSTCASYLVKKLKKKHKNVIMVDGDEIRKICDNDLGYDPVDRKKNAFRIVKLCEYLFNQEMIVVCATVSLYKEIHEWIYEHFENPQIIYLDISKDIILYRNQKKLYTNNENVIGQDLGFDEPIHVDFVQKIVDTAIVFDVLDKMLEKL
ncbi:MAG: adenylyl-sulfate kinase [Holosporaceae bacterium]|nr:adenylyl-sulfate kinase [Holosporaceae bacterium]